MYDCHGNYNQKIYFDSESGLIGYPDKKVCISATS